MKKPTIAKVAYGRKAKYGAKQAPLITSKGARVVAVAPRTNRPREAVVGMSVTRTGLGFNPAESIGNAISEALEPARAAKTIEVSAEKRAQIEVEAKRSVALEDFVVKYLDCSGSFVEGKEKEWKERKTRAPNRMAALKVAQRALADQGIKARYLSVIWPEKMR